MSRFPRLRRRRPDQWASPHARARARAAERLDGPLGLAEAAWLDEHLAACPDCAEIAAAYERDRSNLRALRDAAPVPPRDLWARTAAAIEGETAARGRTRPSGRAARGPRVSLSAASGIALIAVLVVGLSALSGGLFGGPRDVAIAPTESATLDILSASAPASELAGAPTPLIVGAGEVAWVRYGPEGNFYGAAAIERVCPVGATTDCASVDAEAKPLTLDASPRTIIGSPTSGHAVVVGDGEGGDEVLVMTLPTDAPTASPSTTTSPAATEAPPSAPPSSAPPSPSGTPAATGTPTPSEPPPASESPMPSDPPIPSESIAPTVAPIPSATPSAAPSPTPEPTVAATLAIASGLEVVGESAAFSADGTWFAFTARPVDDGGGPDVYVWRVGDERARALTADGRHVFASWVDGQVIASTVREAEAGEGTVEPVSVTIDPATGTETAVADGVWRPVVAPSGRLAVAWTGSLSPIEDGRRWIPVEGRLELRPWPASDLVEPSDVQVVTDGPLAGFDVRWDETGEWFAVWVKDEGRATVGRLSLFRVDPESGRLSQPDGAPAEATALAGFSIGHGRLAWATPPAGDGEGGRIQVVAWRAETVGSLETAPGEDLVVIR